MGLTWGNLVLLCIVINCHLVLGEEFAALLGNKLFK